MSGHSTDPGGSLAETSDDGSVEVFSEEDGLSKGALVFGPTAHAARIARALEQSFGFTTQLISEERLPSPADPNAVEELKNLFSSVQAQSVSGNQPLYKWIHPGVSLWAERLELSRAASTSDMEVIGPPSRVVSLFSNRLGLLAKAEDLDIPTGILSFDPIQSIREIQNLRKRWMGKIILRPCWAGGDGRDFFVIPEMMTNSRKNLATQIDQQSWETELGIWRDQIRRNLGEPILFAERHFEGVRRIEAPFVRFASGELQYFPFVDVSLSKKNHPTVAFCPFQGSDEVSTLVKQWTRKLAQSINYVGVGSLEFLVDGSRTYFVGGMGRLTSYFHLWEEVAGVKAVSYQVAAFFDVMPDSLGSRSKNFFKSSKKKRFGASAQIYSEDPFLQIPQPGKLIQRTHETKLNKKDVIASLSWGLDEGESVSYRSTGLIASLTAVGTESASVIDFCREVLSKLSIAGTLQSNEKFLIELFSHPWISAGIFHAEFLDEDFVPFIELPVQIILACAWTISQSQTADQPVRSWRVASRYKVENSILAKKKIRWKNPPKFWSEEGEAKGVLGVIEFDQEKFSVSACPISDGIWLVRVGDWSAKVQGLYSKPQKKKQDLLFAQLQGRVHSVRFQKAKRVSAGDAIVVIESMQTLVPHALPIDVEIEKIYVDAEDEVRHGQPLVAFRSLK